MYIYTCIHTYTYIPGYFVQKITLISMKFHIGKIKNIYSFLWDIPMSVLTLQKKKKKSSEHTDYFGRKIDLQ